jgi:hypothetical protein
LWCGKPTVENGIIESAEHIFPVAIGGKKTLPAGYVCTECNNKLGVLDDSLKYGHEAMMDAFQADVGIKGRVRNRDDTERKVRERTYIEGKGEAKHTKIKRNNCDVYLINANFNVKSENFVRGLHKCTANILCDTYGSATTRKNYGDLLKFVYDGGNWRPWSYAVSFSNPFQRPLISEPKPFIFSVNGENIAGFLHTSGIWVTGSRPFSLNPVTIEIVSKRIVEKIGHDNEPDPEKAIACFGFNYDLSKNGIVIGKLKFLWMKGENSES